MTRRILSYAAAALLALWAGACGMEALRLVGAATPFPALPLALLLIALVLIWAAYRLSRSAASGIVATALALLLGAFLLNTTMLTWTVRPLPDPIVMAMTKAVIACQGGDCRSVPIRTAPGVPFPGRNLLTLRTARAPAEGECEVFGYIAPEGRNVPYVEADYREYVRARDSARRYGLLWLFDWVYPQVLATNIERGVCSPLAAPASAE